MKVESTRLWGNKYQDRISSDCVPVCQVPQSCLVVVIVTVTTRAKTSVQRLVCLHRSDKLGSGTRILIGGKTRFCYGKKEERVI